MVYEGNAWLGYDRRFRQAVAVISYRDVSVDNWHDPQLISIWIKQSKTDPFRKECPYC